jgi:predicted acylesterase/phospholipase RssA
MARNCDIVMKGGITSGVVYPAAVVEISKKFVFKNIGGTSAGAIAAALTAAAERRRVRDGTTAGFDRLAQIPAWLGTNDHLFHLFVPNAGTRALFNTVVGLFGRSQPAAKLWALMRAFPLATLIGAIPGIFALITAIRTAPITPVWLLVIALLIAGFTIVSGIAIAVGIDLWLHVVNRLPRNYYGMVTGIDDANRSNEVALCTWLATEMELTAGLQAGTPLTFGMLWDAHRDVGLPGVDDKPDNADVNLEMITTNATWGRPYNFPVKTHVFFFDPDEMRCFFPDYIVDWMVARQRAPRDAKEEARFKAYAPRLPLPVAGDLPVIVATRMSLAFPILLSAVPLWVADFTKAFSGPAPELEHCWFSDGGISSNFPITLFDSPLPRWPTFAINLAAFPAGQARSTDESKNVYVAQSNVAARLMPFTRFKDLPGFLSAIFNAMQNWNDNTQSVLPGYRDRIVTVFMDSTEGGLNLDMPPDVLARLRARGAAAGAAIAAQFEAPSVLGPDVGMNWENHRWLRLRSTMGALRDYLTHFTRAMNQPEAPDVPYQALIEATTGTPAAHYPLQAQDRAVVSGIAAQLADSGTKMEATPGIDNQLPSPSPRLVARASLES